MCRASDLDLNNTSLTMTQLSQLLVTVPTTHIQQLTLSGQDLSHVPCHQLVLPVCQVRTLDISNTQLTEEQLSSLLCSCIWSDTIEDLDITGSNLTDVSSQLILDSVACLTCLNISATCMTRKQLISVLQAVTCDWSTLSQLNMSTLDLTSLPSSLLSNTMSQLTCVKLNYCKLSSEQVTAVIRAVARSQFAETLGTV